MQRQHRARKQALAVGRAIIVHPVIVGARHGASEIGIKIIDVVVNAVGLV